MKLSVDWPQRLQTCGQSPFVSTPRTVAQQQRFSTLGPLRVALNGLRLAGLVCDHSVPPSAVFLPSISVSSTSSAFAAHDLHLRSFHLSSFLHRFLVSPLHDLTLLVQLSMPSLSASCKFSLSWLSCRPPASSTLFFAALKFRYHRLYPAFNHSVQHIPQRLHLCVVHSDIPALYRIDARSAYGSGPLKRLSCKFCANISYRRMSASDSKRRRRLRCSVLSPGPVSTAPLAPPPPQSR